MNINDNWKPDKHSKVPLYEQIKIYIKNKIIEGEWPVGSKIPTQRSLAEQFEVNRSTIITAIEDLVAKGVLKSKTKVGTIVNNNCSNISTTPPPDWKSYVRAGLYQQNYDLVQKISLYETSSDLIKLGACELSPELYPETLIDTISRSLVGKRNSLGYEHPKGSIELRRTLSEYLKTIGIEASPEQILIVSGVIQALHLISIGILYKGSTILTEKSSYIYSVPVFQSAQMRLYGIPMDEEGLIVDSITKYKRQRNAAILYTIPSFQNPTGFCMSDKRKKAIIEKCTHESLPIIEDDTYRELYLGNEAPKLLKAFDHNDLVLLTGSLSKTLSPGLRLGWVVGNEEVIERLSDIKMQTDYGCSSLSQIAVNEIISSGYYFNHLENTRKQLKIRRDIALDALAQYFSDIADWKTPQGGFYIWLTLKKPVSMQRLFNECVIKKLLINPGNLYQYQSNKHIRISYSYASHKELEYGIKILSEVIRSI